MAVEHEYSAVKSFEDWYVDYEVDDRDGCLNNVSASPAAESLWKRYEKYRTEHRKRVANYDILEKLVDNEVISPKDDLPNVGSGETAGIVRRTARMLVQHTPNVEVISEHDDESVKGVFARYILTSKIIGSDNYASDMQQNLFASTKTAFGLGFACVLPVLLQNAAGGWYVHYDSIYYQDVMPEPGAKDIRLATDVFIRRYLTKGEVKGLIRDQTSGWDVAALKSLLKTDMPARQRESVDLQSRKHQTIPEGYEIITWYSSTGDPFLTFSANTKQLLRIEQNNHPLKWHPVHFLVLEKDENQPLGKSQVELLIGRQEFQDLMLNGAMKQWYRNINPSIIGYGTVNGSLNLSPGKYTPISNPNARVEPFEVSTQTLLQYNSITQTNHASMVELVGAADQQMATMNGGMSATPQGVEAQEAMVDVTTNNYQKAIESFFSHYCSYGLTIFFQELKGSQQGILPTADARKQLINAGVPPEEFEEDGTLKLKWKDLATEYFVRCIPGSLVEMEDEKQLRILQSIFVPLSQAMPALAASQDQAMLANAAYTMQYILEKTIELSGSADSRELKQRFTSGVTPQLQEITAKSDALETQISGFNENVLRYMESQQAADASLDKRLSQQEELTSLLLEKLGVSTAPSAAPETNPTAA